LRFSILGALCAVLAACGGTGGTAELATPGDSASYVIGYQVGGNLKRQGVPANPEAILRGLRDGLNGADPVLTEEQAQATMMALQSRLMNEARRRDSAAASKNAAEGAAFLQQNGQQPGVRTSSTGLQWKVLREGAGPRPGASSVVTVHYKGSLLDGTVFDSSSAGSPVSFPLNEVIPGWTEGVQLMRAGSRYQFWLPPALAYGERGSPPVIGPNQTLAFEIELVSFK
jgi:FKBP-type peptidyl-prolyl cis-trans isomerase